MCHQIDTVAWFMGIPYPKSAVSSGGLYQWADGRMSYDTFTTILEYGESGVKGKGFQCVFQSHQHNCGGGANPNRESPIEKYFGPNGCIDMGTGKVTNEGVETKKWQETDLPTPTPVPAPTGKLYERVPGMEMPGEKVNGHEYIGTLSIPSLGLKVPVQRNWSYENLSVSPCRYSGSAYAGNLTIIAHTYHFGKLSSLALDATITFTDMENNVFRYVVREINTISPNDANEIAHSGYDLTLVTCTLSGTKRVAVYCERVK